MKLLDLYIENFGKLSDFSLKFTDGVNLLEKENGYGKTTLTVFIKSMLYGLDETKSAKLDKNSRKRYAPWQGGNFGGQLSFESGGKKYRIERSFGKRAGEDSFKLYDLDSGKESCDFTQEIGEELFGIDADGFERTVFLSEANLSGKNENKTVSAKLSNLVGYDGDLSDMDEAIELLNKRRQIYYKHGGSGEISEVKKQISRIDYEINDLTRLGETLVSEEEKLVALTRKINECAEQKELLINEAKRFGELKIKQALAEEYSNMQTSLEREEKALSELRSFFADGVPAAEEIEEARENIAKAKTIKESAATSRSAELDALCEYFSDKATSEEFFEAQELLRKAKEKRSECQRLEDRLDTLRKSAKAPIPSISEVSEHIDALTSAKEEPDVNKGGHTLFFVSFMLTVLSLVLGIAVNPLLLLIMIPTLPLFYISVKPMKKGGKVNTGTDAEEKARLFICEQDSALFENGETTLEKLYTLRSLARAREESREEFSRLDESLAREKGELCEYTDGIRSFVLRFQPAATECISALESILHKRELYLALLSTKTGEIKQREAELLRADELLARGNAFLNRFPTKSPRPFDEISEKLIEYSSLTRSTEAARERILKFRREHGISENIPKPDLAAEKENGEKQRELSELLTSLEREKALTERQINALTERVSKIDELTAEKEALIEKRDNYQRELDTLLLTREMLILAKDSLTAKYLSKTKSAFDKYIALTSEFSTGDFVMDTSFSIMKNERGSFRAAEAYSRGERDLFSLAARLALVDSLYENEAPFIVLDDPFAYFDDERLSAALDVIKEVAKQRQIIYLTCTSARKI